MGVERPPQGRINYGRISNTNSNGTTLVNYSSRKTIREDKSKINNRGGQPPIQGRNIWKEQINAKISSS